MSYMKSAALLLTMVIVTGSCEKNDFSHPISLEYTISFESEPMPHSVVARQDNGDMLVLNIHHSKTKYNVKVSRYSKDGGFVATVIDFSTFDEGAFAGYIPADIALDEFQNLYVLVRPKTGENEESWIMATGFNILKFDGNGNFLEEIDFSHLDGESTPRNIACMEHSIVAENGSNLKIISLETGTLSEIPLPEDPSGTEFLAQYHTDMEIDPDGLFYFSGPYHSSFDSSGCRISRFNIQTNELEYTVCEGWWPILAAKVGEPGLSIHQNGDIYLSTYYGSSIEVYNRNMAFLLEKRIDGPGEETPSAVDIATYKNYVYVADQRNDLIHVYFSEN